MNQEPIFLLGTHKSGTSLLRSLFDSHSELFTIPIETHFFQNMQYWVDYEYRAQRPKKLSDDQIIDNFCNFIHERNTTKDPYSDSIAEGLFNETLFREVLLKIRQSESDKERMEQYFKAIYQSIYSKPLPENVRVVEKSIENAEFAIVLSLLFPEAKFIHIVRNPYANIVSLRKFKAKEHGYPLIPRLISSLYNSYYYLYKNSKVIKNYHIITYENLVTNPEKVIFELCDFLGIKFEKSLLIPTFLNNEWEGNSTSGKKFDRISTSQLASWKDQILPVEAYYINQTFPFLLKDFGYEKFTPHKSFWKKAKGETFKRYLYNRIYKFYMDYWTR